MSRLAILRYPDARLHKIAAPVAEVDDSIRSLVANMAETMYAAPGVGLAATQVDVHKQVIVIDASDTRDKLLTLINPEIIAAMGEADCEEGCLSVPGIYEKIARAEHIVVRALGLDGRSFSMQAEGLLAVCIQHEMDHLKGRVFVEYLSRLKQTRIRAKMTKQQRQSA
ncbi:MAG: peptide deformylase [Burkholderiales bacterium]|nr:peptide deformylase [Burkholderiales bacterium]